MPFYSDSHTLRTIYTMALLVEARDAYTGGHLWRVSQYSYLLGKGLDLPEDQCQVVAMGGFVHDLGKVGIPDAILNKKGALTDEEYAVIKTHPNIGADLLTEHPLSDLVIEGVLSHHERPDGKGYPNNLRGSGISTMATVIGIADAFDAMTSTRPYRSGMPISQALEIIGDNLDTQFDPAVGEKFIALGKAGKWDSIVGHSQSGVPMLECPACGPIVVASIHKKKGADTLLCPGCTGEFLQSLQNGKPVLEFTGNYFPVEAKQPKIDFSLIAQMIPGA